MTSSTNPAPGAPYEDRLIEQLKDSEQAEAYLRAVTEDGDRGSDRACVATDRTVGAVALNELRGQRGDSANVGGS